MTQPWLRRMRLCCVGCLRYWYLIVEAPVVFCEEVARLRTAGKANNTGHRGRKNIAIRYDDVKTVRALSREQRRRTPGGTGNRKSRSSRPSQYPRVDPR